MCIDSAWGSNFGIVEGLPGTPIADADIVITSPHKKGAAPSQVGLVLFHETLLVELYDEASRAGCETTSPNWNLLLLFEHRLMEIAQGRWNQAWQKAIEEAARFREQLVDINPNLVSPAPEHLGYASHDPTHMFVCTASAHINGLELAEALSRDFQIDAEMSGPNGVLFLFGPTHSGKSATLVNAMKDALRRIDRSTADLVQYPRLCAISKKSGIARARPAYFSSSQSLPLKSCKGQTSASLIYAYPPGVPLLAYGETISAEHIEAICRLSKLGVGLTGLSDDMQIRVTRAPPRDTSNRQVPRQSTQPSEIMTTIETASTLSITGYPFGQAPRDVVDEVARLFREIFCNPPYNQFAAHRNDPGTPLSFADLAPAGYAAVEDYQSLDLLDSTKLPEECFRWMEPGEFEDRFRAKAHQLYIVTGHDEQTRELNAFIVCRVLTVRELFYTEEFRNPVYFSSREYLRTLRSAKEFYQQMDHHFGLSPEDQLWWIVGMVRSRPRAVKTLYSRA